MLRNAAHPTPYTLHPTPYTLHPTPYTLRPTPCTLRPTPFALHPAPCTLHPTPYTLNINPLVSGIALPADRLLNGIPVHYFRTYVAAARKVEREEGGGGKTEAEGEKRG